MYKVNIKILNHIYATSISKGGYGTFFSSNEFNIEDLKEIEKIVSYSHAYDLPRNPTNEEIENLFPVNYSFYRFKNSNKIAVFQSKYTGRCNHTPDRFGNFISHSIIFEYNDFLNIPNIFSNFKFRNSLTVEEEANFSEGSRELEYDSSKIDFDFYINNLKNNPKSLNTFLLILDLIINGWLNDGQKNITLLGTKEETETIIFALYTLLPSTLINKFSFATYVSNPNKYPFQITGIIKEAGITRLDSNYFNFIEVDKLSEYNIQNEFTEYFRDLILKNEYSYKDLNNIIKEYNITSFSKNLNFIPKRIVFFENIKNQTIDDYKKIINFDLSIDDVLKVKNEHPELFFGILVDLLVKDSKNLKEFLEILKYLHDTYFVKDEDFTFNYFYLLFSTARKKVNFNNTSELSIYLLNNYKLSNQNDIQDELKNVDKYLEKNEIEKENLLKLIEDYKDYIKKEDMYNLFKNKQKIEFENILKEGKLKARLLQGDEDFKELNQRDKFDLLSGLIWFENEKGKFDLLFNEYKELVKKYLENSMDEFWSSFFKSKFNEDNNDRHSLSYLKRNFIISCSRDVNDELAKKIDLCEREKWWIDDYKKENSTISQEW